MSIYLDHAATTPMIPRAIEEMSAALSRIGNPSSLHADGRAVRKEIEDARDFLASSIGCAPSEIIFTGSGTEANNIAVKGIYWLRNQDQPRRLVVTSSIEHQAVLEPAQWLVGHEGAELIEIPALASGVIDIEFLANLIATRGQEIALISVMHSNNETGVLQPVEEVVALAGDIPVHSDAIQSWTKTEFSFNKLGLFAASFSGHKVGGPVGIGILVLRRGIDLPALIHGGGQEREIRSGTVNAPSIIGLAAAVRHSEYVDFVVEQARQSIESRLRYMAPDAIINGADAKRLPGILSVTFPGASNETLLMLFDAEGISCSTGAACSAGVHRPSHVLLAMGIDEDLVMSTIRFSLGMSTTRSDFETMLEKLPIVLERARGAQ
jgi:cysteine desulfurase